jgi:hypothetical protein
MGSTSLASLIEKFGYINAPVRKRRLNQCLHSKSEEDYQNFINRTVDKIYEMAKLRRGGGVSVVKRDTAKPIIRLEISLIIDELESFKNKNCESLHDLYFESMRIISKGIIYKNKADKYKGAIENTTDIMKYSNEIIKEYKKEFADVKFFHMHRDFIGWINSLAAQLIQRKQFTINNYLFRLSTLIKRYNKYEAYVKDLPGIHIHFDDLFIPNTSNIISKINDYLGDGKPNIYWDTEMYDLYGTLCDYQTTFTKMDDNINFLSKHTKYYASMVLKHNKFGSISDVTFLCLYLFDFAIFKFKKRIFY